MQVKIKGRYLFESCSNIGNIDQLCNLVSKNYSINFKSVKPSAAMQPNGVVYNRAEWQISKYSNTDFGPDAWQYGSNWSFHVSPNTEYNMGPPSNITYLRSMVSFKVGFHHLPAERFIFGQEEFSL